MKRIFLVSSFSLAIISAAGMPAEAQAVFLNPNGTGQVLVFPYYTVNADNITLLTLTNSTNQGKAIKVRILEGYNSRDVLDFNLYLSPQDMWAGAVIAKGGGAAIFTPDSSCTVPKLPNTGDAALVFSTAAFDGSTQQGKDGGPTDVSRTLEGHIEVIEMGTVTNAARGSLDAIAHAGQPKGAPADCTQISNAWGAGGYWTANPQTDIGPASGGLSGLASIVNVGQGTIQGYTADAIAQFYQPGTSGVHTDQAALTPNIASGTSLTSLTYPGEAAVASSFANAIDAVSSLFMAETMHNEFWTANSIAASSEWVVTFPTKRFYTDPYYVNQQAKMPFARTFGSADFEPATSCDRVSEGAYDREAYQKAYLEPTLPPGGWGYWLCHATQIVAFSQGAKSSSRILGSRLTEPFLNPTAHTQAPQDFFDYLPGDAGWARISFVRAGLEDRVALKATNGNTFLGLPVTGFLATQLINGSAGGAGVLANYTAQYRHKYSVRCVNGTGLCS